MNIEVITADKDPDVFGLAQQLVHEAFAPFMDHSEIVNRFWWQLYERWPEWQFVLREPQSADILALGNTIPLRFEGRPDELPDGGVEWALAEAVSQHEAGIPPNIACAFQIVIGRPARGKGLSYRSVDVMREITARAGFRALVAPVRPNRKENYPDMPFEAYVAWRREDGLPADDWLRVHVRLGGEIGPVCRRSFVVQGTFDEWAEWTGQRFDADGPHHVKGALAPVAADLIAGTATYIEPNIWVWHDVG
jgi:hypothetical protein